MSRKVMIFFDFGDYKEKIFKKRLTVFDCN